MAQELNFDELDHAVNQYMQRKVADRPASTSLNQRTNVPVASSHPPSVGPRPTPSASLPPKRSDVSADSHQAAAPVGQDTFRIAKVIIQILGNHQLQHGVAQKLQSLVMLADGLFMFVQIRPVRKRRNEQLYICKLDPQNLAGEF